MFINSCSLIIQSTAIEDLEEQMMTSRLIYPLPQYFAPLHRIGVKKICLEDKYCASRLVDGTVHCMHRTLYAPYIVCTVHCTYTNTDIFHVNLNCAQLSACTIIFYIFVFHKPFRILNLNIQF